jgi:hypothetical protein
MCKDSCTPVSASLEMHTETGAEFLAACSLVGPQFEILMMSLANVSTFTDFSVQPVSPAAVPLHLSFYILQIIFKKSFYCDQGSEYYETTARLVVTGTAYSTCLCA